MASFQTEPQQPCSGYLQFLVLWGLLSLLPVSVLAFAESAPFFVLYKFVPSFALWAWLVLVVRRVIPYTRWWWFGLACVLTPWMVLSVLPELLGLLFAAGANLIFLGDFEQATRAWSKFAVLALDGQLLGHVWHSYRGQTLVLIVWYAIVLLLAESRWANALSAKWPSREHHFLRRSAVGFSKAATVITLFNPAVWVILIGVIDFRQHLNYADLAFLIIGPVAAYLTAVACLWCWAGASMSKTIVLAAKGIVTFYGVFPIILGLISVVNMLLVQPEHAPGIVIIMAIGKIGWLSILVAPLPALVLMRLFYSGQEDVASKERRATQLPPPSTPSRSPEASLE